MVQLIGVTLCVVVELHPRSVFSPCGGNIFRGLQIWGQKRASGEPLLASQTPISAI